MNIQTIREDIPLTRDLIYFDNASTSLMPSSVTRIMEDYETSFRSNVGRGVHRLSQVSSQLYWDAHEKVKAFIGGTDGVSIFGKNCTEGINQVAYGLRLNPGDHVITSVLEHHSNILPWMHLRKQGISVDFVRPDAEGYLHPQSFSELIQKETRLITFTHVSNVTGTIQPAKEICSISHDHDIKTLLDGAQSVPHIPVDVSDIGCDYLSFSGHKMLGPTGTGVLWMKEPDLEPFILGGGSIKSVTTSEYTLEDGYMKYEAGTPHITGAVGLREAIRILNHVGMRSVQEHELSLTRDIIHGLSHIPGVTLYGPKGTDSRLGVVSFTIEGQHPHESAHLLDDQYDIMVRSGHHCCMPLMDHFAIPDGTVRASLYLYNTREEVKKFLEAVTEISEGI
ncbi:cysteine desulfurase [Methanospirillum hungatei JF-1]|jgi:cysteine desulfurase/selenocysteine lyase|uniref:cysteine desulfurase n=1 Tax=Methanospirillum hungatei JF-1 (strain ATCC 27890 / DSM 864 / NBRC 100397 / JF-1) TaxID=323259 RepID=Q2FSX1_METHJ|nr:cysteine desulfurase [Methanospirillum hungatei]ABD41908.1 cysteine desulfurase [Methanospirillum hungatei JF-1]MBP9007108.1 cysteine desulfurase [Methanospirillum sp.]OQA60672.1 MAG: putative cysteine desulfurase 2 [Euryarchaeota archaeon ADurb.Bin294]HOW03642.1 cysteine desulfurase [Methanospirillum hungatei]